MKKYLPIIIGITGIACLILSFIIHAYFLQFLVLGIFALVVTVMTWGQKEAEEIKQIIREHTEIVKKDIEERKKEIDEIE